MKRVLQWALCALVFTSSQLFAGMQPSPACLQDCSDSYDNCVANDPGCTYYGECERCQNDYNHCVGFCPMVCVEPYSQSTSDTVQNWNGPRYTGFSGCYKQNSQHSMGYYYLETEMQRKHTTVTTTTHCDGTTSQSTTEWFDYLYCWESTYQTCYQQNLWSNACSIGY